MKKIFFLIVALGLVVFMAAPVMAQGAYTLNPEIGQGGARLKYGVKAHPVSITLIEYDKTMVGGDTTVALLKANKRFSFVAPFTCLLDSMWIVYSGIVTADTFATADTNAGLIIRVFTGGGSATAPATAAYVCSTSTRGATTAIQLAGKLRANTARYGAKNATIANRTLTAGEVYSVVIDTMGAGPSIIPRRLIAGWNLIPPDK